MLNGRGNPRTPRRQGPRLLMECPLEQHHGTKVQPGTCLSEGFVGYPLCQKAREGCGNPKFLAGRVSRQFSTLLEFPAARHAIPAKVWAIRARKTAAGKSAPPSVTPLDFLLQDGHSLLEFSDLSEFQMNPPKFMDVRAFGSLGEHQLGYGICRCWDLQFLVSPVFFIHVAMPTCPRIPEHRIQVPYLIDLALPVLLGRRCHILQTSAQVNIQENSSPLPYTVKI